MMHKQKKIKGDMAFKIDIQKAYDHVNWDYLRGCLQDFGFPQITIDLITFCVSSSSLSLIWNGQKLQNFTLRGGCAKGIRYPLIYL